MKKNTRTQQNGFTLIELLVAATILAILTTIAVVSFQAANIRARDGKRKGDLEQVRAALELYRSDTQIGGKYPGSSSQSSLSTGFTDMTTTLNNAGYLSAPLPVDPKSGYSYTYKLGSTLTTYCLCAHLESSATAGNSSDTSCSFTSSGGAYYCVVNP